MIKSKKIIFLILISLSALILSEPAGAQNIGRENIESALRMTEEIIQQAKEIVQNSRSQKARLRLQKASTLQNKARSEAGNFTNARKNALSYKLTMEAREEAKRAIASAKTETRILEKHRRIFEGTREKLSGLRERLINNDYDDMRTRKFIHDAEAMLEKSRTNMTQMRSQLALKLALNAQKLTSQAENRFRKIKNTRKMCERRLALMKRLTSRARDRIEESKEEKNRYRISMAEKELEKAKSLFREGRYNACRMTLVKSEKMIRNLINNLNSSGGEDRVREMLKQTWQFHERTKEAFERSQGSPDRGILKQAEKMLKAAEQNIRNGNTDQATRFINRARSILRKGSESAGPEITPGRIQARLEIVDSKKKETEIVIRNCRKEEGRALYERAVKHLNKAHQHFKNSQLKSASAEAGIANNLFDRITEICSI